MRMLRQELPVVDARKGDIGGFELFYQFGDIVPGKTCGNFRVGLPPVLDALRIGCKFRVFAERRLAQYLLRQHLPLAIVLDRNQNVRSTVALLNTP
jgi:hypothetical protein